MPNSNQTSPSPFESGLPTEYAERTVATEKAYLDKALWFEGYAARMMGIENITPIEVAACAITRKPEWATRTWRYMKAALIFRYKSMNTSEASQAVEMLLAETQAGTLKRSKRTSARRKKNFGEEELKSVLDDLSDRRSSYAPIVRDWLKFGAMLGLRPHEWCFSEIVMLAPADITGYGSADAKTPYLRVSNGKNTHGRSHGVYRHIDMREIPKETIADVSDFCKKMASIAAAGEFDALYMGCKQLLNRVNQRHEDSQKRRLQLYSPRHHFSGNAKKYLSLQEVAALMGHKSNRTASDHYGRRAAASGGVAVRPLSAEVERVELKKPAIPSHLNSANVRNKTDRKVGGKRKT